MTNAVACLDPETIAAYLDRRLDPAERVRVEEHLADCEECRTLLSETALFLEADAASGAAPASSAAAASPVRSRRTPWMIGLAAAAAVAALTPFVLQQVRPTPESALEELDRALAGKRYVEGRLLGFEYGTFVSATRGPQPARGLVARGRCRRQGGGRYAASDRPRGSRPWEHPNSPWAASRRRSRAWRTRPRWSPRTRAFRVDLAAAYLARMGLGDDPDTLHKARTAAAAAVAFDPSSREAAFNYALAIEALLAPEDALRARGTSTSSSIASSQWTARSTSSSRRSAPSNRQGVRGDVLRRPAWMQGGVLKTP